MSSIVASFAIFVFNLVEQMKQDRRRLSIEGRHEFINFTTNKRKKSMKNGNLMDIHQPSSYSSHVDDDDDDEKCRLLPLPFDFLLRSVCELKPRRGGGDGLGGGL